MYEGWGSTEAAAFRVKIDSLDLLYDVKERRSREATKSFDGLIFKYVYHSIIPCLYFHLQFFKGRLDSRSMRSMISACLSESNQRQTPARMSY